MSPMSPFFCYIKKIDFDFKKYWTIIPIDLSFSERGKHYVIRVDGLYIRLCDI